MATLRVPPKKAVSLLTERIEAMGSITVYPDGLEYYDVVSWCSKTWPVIEEIYGSSDPHYEELRMVSLSNCSCGAHTSALLIAEVFETRLQDYIAEIQAGMQDGA